ncbi:alpha-L-rhamnosidase [Streptomyces sp. VRA16 Mangrove soil]|uniref:alpha-L-rhamnosidase n=1 Tax=Streptomyces sp. VRA16 Mangrove soil TaxID=2817434 RepID=UPI001A9F20A0|nr:alpha-L-rhamnosidase [Streptomyces sp. VRA16 Mangrove soil]MBO1330325.1 family 78 glycoside hydrolase catalytic domain [Streptomyces sp. VRA16 Mangrove soil]
MTSDIRRRTVLAATAGAVPVVAAAGTFGAAAPASAATASPTLTRNAAPDGAVTGLTVEHRVLPLGTDATRPRFGWRLGSRRRGLAQGAYRVRVATSAARLASGRGDVWDSGRVASSDSVAVTYAGPQLEPSTRYFWTVSAWDTEGRPVGTSAPAWFETSLLSTDGVTRWDGAQWIGMKGKTPNSQGAPLLRAEAPLTKGRRVGEARLYVTALGVYEAYVNGERVTVPQDGGRTVELLTPGWTNYDMTVNYMTYDVTDLVAAGRGSVTVGAVLGNGWYNARISEGSTYYAKDGNPLALKAKLLIRYTDGSTQTLVTKEGANGGAAWKATDTGPYRADDIYDGQTYDARQELGAWTAGGFDASTWSDVEQVGYTTKFPKAKLVAYPGETARLMARWDRTPQSVTVYDKVTGQASSANGKGRIVPDPDRSTAKAPGPVTLRTGDTAVFDLGQNMVGVPRYSVRGPAGAHVIVRTGEMLNDDSAGADGPAGSLYRANLRSAKSTSTYVLKGADGGETHQDSLAFYGFRYVSVEVTTPDTEVTFSGLVGKVGTSALTDTGSLTTDDEDVNQLMSNVRWGQRGNYLWVPTDCPQRDERLGWTGDTQVFSHTGLYNTTDAVSFLSHFEEILIESQKIYGVDGAQFTAVAPGNRYNAAAPCSGWADCGVIVPWTVWQMSGDTTVVDRSWDAMVHYIDWIKRKGGDTYAGQGAIFADWLAFQNTGTQLMSDVYYAYSVRLMAQMARATGRDDEAKAYDELFGNIRKAFLAQYVQVDGDTITVKSSIGGKPPMGGDPEDNSQSALLWVLKLGFYDTQSQRRALVGLLADNIGNDAAYKAAHPDSARVQYAENTLSVGFLGSNVIAPVLTDEGRADLAYRLLHQDAMPSWLYSVKNGATTVWERWNSYSKEDGFGPVEMNSFNHYSYGAIAEWMYAYMAGIAGDPDHPGFRHFTLRPHLDPTGGITRASGRFLSPYGEIGSAWSLAKDGTLTYEAVVPANTTATLTLPAVSADAVREGRTPLGRVDGVRLVGFADGAATFTLPAGRYEVTSATR